VREVELEDVLGRQPLLRIHELQFVAAGQFEVGPGLRTHTDPIEPLGGLAGAVGLDGDLEVGCVEGVDQRLVDLKQGFAAGTNDQRVTALPLSGHFERTASARSAGVSKPPPPGPSVPTKSVSQNWQTASSRSSSRPVHRLQPENRQKTAGRPVLAPSPCSV
jgi:hypothetical protein